MKKSFSLAILIVVFASYACQQDVLTEAGSSSHNDRASNEEKSSTSPHYNQRSFSKAVGEPISHETGTRWIDNLKDAGRSNTSYVLTAKDFIEILQNPMCVGISLHFAQDHAGKIFILPFGIDQNGHLIKRETVATQAGTIDWQTAQEWISNYTGAVHSHFFGADTFSRLLTEGVTEINLTEALDDRNNPQLLLTKGKSKGKSKGNSNDDYEDGSWPCPPMCP